MKQTLRSPLKIRALLPVVLALFFSATLYADGLPGEYYITQRWRDLLAGHSPAANPAFMTEENYVSLRAALSPTIHNTFLLMEFGAIVPVGLYQSFGVSYLGLAPTDEVAVMEYNEALDDIVPTGDTLNDVQSLFILSYAINPLNRLSIGANINVYHQTNFNEAVTGAGIDLALSYRFLRHPLLGNNVIGINLQNIVSPDFSFKNFQHEAVNLKMSWLGKFWESRIDAGVDLDIKDVIPQAKNFVENTAQGGNAPTKTEFDVNARLGCWILGIINAYVQGGTNYWGMAFGVNVPTVNIGRDFQIAYQYMSMIDDVDLNTTHTFYFRGDFGKHREEIYARQMAKAASLGPTNLYNKARTLYAEGKYWESFFLFGKILNEYPDFFKNDWVQLHMGLSQEALDMRESATENFMKTIQAFPRSETVFHAELGMLRLHYRDGNSYGVANQFDKLNTSAAPDSLKCHAYYYMGLQNIKGNEHKKALQLFELIPANHPEYAFGQFSSGIAYIATGDVNNAIMSLYNAVQSTPSTPAQQEIINKSLTLLGYIYYEGAQGVEPNLQQAVAVLRKVPATSYYYEDAQLGLAWAALKGNNWVDCVKASDEILRISKKTALQCEAMLCKGYSAMINKKFDEAVNILTPASEILSKTNPPSQSQKDAGTEQFYTNRDSYYKIAETMNDLAYTGQTSYIIKKIDSLHAPQMEVEKKIRDYYTFADEFDRLVFFSKNLETLRNDIEYALAKSSKMAGTGRSSEIQERAGEKLNKIDDEIEKYQEELKKLDNDKKKEIKNEAPEETPELTPEEDDDNYNQENPFEE